MDRWADLFFILVFSIPFHLATEVYRIPVRYVYSKGGETGRFFSFTSIFTEQVEEARTLRQVQDPCSMSYPVALSFE